VSPFRAPFPAFLYEPTNGPFSANFFELWPPSRCRSCEWHSDCDSLPLSVCHFQMALLSALALQSLVILDLEGFKRSGQGEGEGEGAATHSSWVLPSWARAAPLRCWECSPAGAHGGGSLHAGDVPRGGALKG